MELPKQQGKQTELLRQLSGNWDGSRLVIQVWLEPRALLAGKVPLSCAGAAGAPARLQGWESGSQGFWLRFHLTKLGGFAMKMWVLLALSGSSVRRMSFV